MSPMRMKIRTLGVGVVLTVTLAACSSDFSVPEHCDETLKKGLDGKDNIVTQCCDKPVGDYVRINSKLSQLDPSCTNATDKFNVCVYYKTLGTCKRSQISVCSDAKIPADWKPVNDSRDGALHRDLADPACDLGTSKLDDPNYKNVIQIVRR